MIRYLFLLLFISCSSNNHEKKIDSFLESIKKKYAPDKRVALFDIRFSHYNNNLVLDGETNLLAAKEDFLNILDSLDIKYDDNIDLLPNEKIYGIINNSVGNLRGKPSHSSELVSQTLLGTKVNILKKEGEWYLIQTPDNYISWIDHGGIAIVSETEYLNYYKDNYIFNQIQGFTYESIHKKEIVSDLVVGSILSVIDKKNNFYKIQYPDNRVGWVDSRYLSKVNVNSKSSASDLIINSKKFIGVPYLWGGTSSKGFDCSGFTKTVYLMSGLVIPRDASQQVNEGLLVDREREWDKLQEGDLMFFGYYKEGIRRIDHVAIWMGNGNFIQASKNVRINSVYSDNPAFDKYHMDKYIEARRVIGHETDGVKKL
ncbi:MAG: glycoside hydrolase [Cytophagia bacterium]|nr:glycoside hydrolase [Cytophagia bacterium]